MINLGLSATDKRAFEATLTQSHRIQITAHIHNHDEKIIHSFSGSILSGAVQVDATQAGDVAPGEGSGPSGPVRTLDLTVLLPRKTQAWLPDAPGDESVFADNFVSVLYGVWVEDLSTGPDWVDVPVFWGPITHLDQDGDQVTIRAEGKEVLGMVPALLWTPLTIRKGTNRMTVIRRILQATGEARFDLPSLRGKISINLSLGRHAEPWVFAARSARYVDRQLFYDGYGRVRLRRYPRNRLWLFHGGENGSLLSKPKVAYDISEARNTVEVLGSRPKGSPQRIRAVARPTGTQNPLSPWGLRRNNQSRFLVHVEDSSDVNTRRKAQDMADRLLAQLLTATVTVEFDSLVIPHLEEGDRVAVLVPDSRAGDRVVEGQHIEFSLHRFTIPLVSGEAMSVGVNRRVSWRRRKSGSHSYRWGV